MQASRISIYAFIAVQLTCLIWIEISIAGPFSPPPPIRVGILHSLTGTMSASEKPVVDATLLAIEEINAQGGLLGHRIEAVIADGKSDEEVFAREAERLISEEHVSVLFGCWTSASRKAVLPVIEAHNHLLFYPVQYEGMEQSEDVIYTGAVPNQQILPTVNWAVRTFGPRLYLLGSDYIFPHAANWLIRKQALLLQAEIVGEHYVKLGSPDMNALIADIRRSKPDVILNTVNGSSNIALFHALKAAGITSKQVPVISFSLGAAGMQAIPADEVVGHYAAWSYFQSLPGEANSRFTRAYHQKYGNLPITDPMEAAWIGVNLWASAVRGARTWSPNVIHHSVLSQSMAAPEGVVSVDPVSHHLWKTARIGKINTNKQFDIVWSSAKPLRPYPYPLLITRHEADLFLGQLNMDWNGHWSSRPELVQP
ncbi:MAG: urea ABC transporter substrate-binding protein [Zetaproteobacteria bacterium CG12_big_fil_rev_8_21_14_0_65_54_13]|nr:MAG: urea ABC transporter substrate-binding protein [Zetaproteobacteria bacterium CG23_combo_of_CG06-09_8_20_14_all_54_7]PIW44092.1 MAG: urea ABC transporter substrate-binding protein [Zetaproteobacteria bacterium CG12_big_fil_rev_8_21_14_0_65_54_13]